MGKLTDVQIRQWVKAGKPVAGKSDGDGLTFTRSAKGTTSWVLRYSWGGKQRELHLGRYPDLTLSKARELAAEKRVEVMKGANVAQVKRDEKNEQARARTFKGLSEDYCLKVAPVKSLRYRAELRRYLDKDILPRIGSMMAADIKPADIVDLVERIAKRSKTVAINAFAMVSAIFTHGVHIHVVESNPCAKLKASAIIGQKDAPRARVNIADAQLSAFLTALPDLGRENELAIKILLATAVRKNELTLARWEHVDFDAGVWIIPVENQKATRSKRVFDFAIPLAPWVAGKFRELQTLAGNSPMVLPARHRTGAETINRGTLNRAMSSLPDPFSNVTPHDLRATARSHFAALGINPIIAERCLNHTLGGVVAIYDRHDYLDERRHALTLWAAKLEAAEKGEAFNVVPFQRVA
jgi:integrase